MLAYLPGTHAPAGATVLTEEGAHNQGKALVLGWHEGRLSLWPPMGRETPVAVDFLQGALGYRISQGRVKHERLVKAMGRLPNNSLIVDATAGLGRDSALLAAAGFEVLMLEANPVLQQLLSDGLLRLQGQLPLRLITGRAEDILPQLAPQVVYLDPMFPERRKSAAVKKELAWLQYIAPIPSHGEEANLLNIARRAATHKVVVKRPANAPFLGAETPNSQLPGKAVRFDVYLPIS